MYGCKGWSFSFDWIFFVRKTTKSLKGKNLNGLQLKLVFLRIWFVVHCFFICINDLSDNLEPNEKLFVDDTSMLSVVSDPINTSLKLNNDLDKVSLWVNK